MAYVDIFNAEGLLKISKTVFFKRCRIKILPLSTLFGLILSFCLVTPSYSFMSDNEIAFFQKVVSGWPVGDRIAYWAEKFVDTPYDPDPMGEYVTRNVLIADERVDCMYLTFRAAELALSSTPEEAVKIALDKRFIDTGVLDEKGNVLNYEDRFQYAEDMLDSGKWGREITEDLGKTKSIKGSRGRDKVKIMTKKVALSLLKDESKDKAAFKNGDFIFFIKAVDKRKVGEIIGHIGIVKIEEGVPYLIHATGSKNKGGKVEKIKLVDYLDSMIFIGIKAGRFD